MAPKNTSGSTLKKIETQFEHLLFTSRWLMAPVYLGLVVAMLVLLYKFGKDIFALFGGMTTISGGELIIAVLSLVDVALIMNLLIIIVFSGYENFVSRMDDLHDHEDRPDWMGHIGFSDLKVKLIGSMVAISGIELLKAFMHISQRVTQVGSEQINEKVIPIEDHYLIWLVVIHVVFLFSGIFYALMDRLSSKH
ncbi:MAG: TIGR00645 family protein [Betaproteobacteria bacterium]|nr:TIGR00645 family protein [Betaproteobacteria bacterium]